MSELIQKYCDLVLNIGIGIKGGDSIFLKCPAKDYQYAQVLAKQAYEYGAKTVRVEFYDEQLNGLKINSEPIDDLKIIPEDVIAVDKVLSENLYKTITIVSPQFDLEPVPSLKSLAMTKATLEVAGRYRKLSSSDKVAWCICALPNKSWANKVFGDKPDNVKHLQKLIYASMRLDDENYQLSWQKHTSKLRRVATKLNDSCVQAIEIKTDLGTDVRIELAPNHLWKTAGEKFVANLPTEEIYTMPHKYRTTGVIVASKPLIYNNLVYPDLRFEFKAGKLVNVAGEGAASFKQIVTNVEGGEYLGEIALVDKHSKVNELNYVFYNTLFDENAGAHIAFGNSFASNLKSVTGISDTSEFMNKSDIHIDVVFGTSDISVVGIEDDGNKLEIIKAGEFTI